MKTFLLVLSVLFLPVTGWASGSSSETLDLTGHTVGILSLIIFSLAYLLVMSEEITHLRKSKPVLLAAGIIWAMIAAVYASHGMPHAAEIDGLVR